MYHQKKADGGPELHFLGHLISGGPEKKVVVEYKKLNSFFADFPKVYCPFVRKTYPIDKKQWKDFGKQYHLHSQEVYLAVNLINPGYEWVFEDPNTFAVELHLLRSMGAAMKI